MRPFLITAIFTGLRSSELRGLRWVDVDLKNGELHVRQRADRYNEMGKPKSEAGERIIPLGPFVVNTLKEWRLACPKGELGFVFPNPMGKIWDHADIVSRHVPDDGRGWRCRCQGRGQVYRACIRSGTSTLHG